MTSDYPPPPPPGAPQGVTESEARTWSALAHLGGIFAYLFIGWLPALVIWLVYRDRSNHVAVESKVALNFQLTLLIGLVVCWVVGQIPLIGLIGFLGQIALGVASLVFSILAFVAVQRGDRYQYPFSLALVR